MLFVVLIIFYCYFYSHRTRPGVPVVHVDGEYGPPDADRRRIRGRDPHGRRRVRVSRGPRARRLFPERRVPAAARLQRTRAAQDQPDRQIRWVYLHTVTRPALDHRRDADE